MERLATFWAERTIYTQENIEKFNSSPAHRAKRTQRMVLCLVELGTAK